jgi:hypothetical protein
MSLFDPQALTGAPPPDPAGQRCLDELQPRPKGWTLRRYPRCNRPVGHDGPHQEIRRADFKVRAEWER